MGRLQDKVAIVTGGASGIGKATCLTYGAEGARVAVADLNLEGAQRTVEEIEGRGGQAIAVRCDVASRVSCAELVSCTVNAWGRVDVLFNNAGKPSPVPLDELTEEEWDRTFAVNTKSVFLLTQLVAPVMRRGGGGSILSTASDAGLIAVGEQSAYIASKGAVIALTRALALELARDNIRVNCICPGWVRTQMMDDFYEQAFPDVVERKAVVAQSEAAQMTGRFGRPSEIAAAALFLASDESSYVTGIAMPVDGGFLACK